MLELILVALLLMIGAVLASVMQENLSGHTHFSLPFASILLVIILGTALFLLWGWVPSLAVLGAYWALCFLGGFSNRAESRAQATCSAASEQTCPQCGSEVRTWLSDGSVVWECARSCGWGVATTNPNQPAFDSQLYDVLAVITGSDKKRVVVRLALALGIPARDAMRMVEQSEPIAKGVPAVEVQRLARLLAESGIGVAVRPDFPWPLTDGG